MTSKGLFTWRWGAPDRWGNMRRVPHLSSKRDQIKMRDYVDRRVTPPKQVTSSTWGPPPPCKQALTLFLKHSEDNYMTLHDPTCIHNSPVDNIHLFLNMISSVTKEWIRKQMKSTKTNIWVFYWPDKVVQD